MEISKSTKLWGASSIWFLGQKKIKINAPYCTGVAVTFAKCFFSMQDCSGILVLLLEYLHSSRFHFLFKMFPSVKTKKIFVFIVFFK